MGLYDSFIIDCPKCGKELEFQSKSGECGLSVYGKKNCVSILYRGKRLSHSVATGLDGDIIRCQFCNARVKFELLNPRVYAKYKISIAKGKKFNYNGNYNPKHPESIKRQKELQKLFKDTSKNKKELKKMGVKV